GRTQSLVAKKKDISENRASRNFDLMITQRRLIAADQASVFMEMMFDHNSSDLAPQRQMVSAENNTSGPAPFLNVQKTFDRSRSSLGLYGNGVY
ncbi:hypothetical protein Tco_0423151, partial [Tanacetum coccineum]